MEPSKGRDSAVHAIPKREEHSTSGKRIVRGERGRGERGSRSEERGGRAERGERREERGERRLGERMERRREKRREYIERRGERRETKLFSERTN